MNSAGRGDGLSADKLSTPGPTIAGMHLRKPEVSPETVAQFLAETGQLHARLNAAVANVVTDELTPLERELLDANHALLRAKVALAKAASLTGEG